MKKHIKYILGKKLNVDHSYQGEIAQHDVDCASIWIWNHVKQKNKSIKHKFDLKFYYESYKDDENPFDSVSGSLQGFAL